jgi:competence protein ComGD
LLSHKKDGFTLVENVMVMIITTIVLLFTLGIFNCIDKTRDSRLEKEFWQQFQRCWDDNLAYAKITKLDTFVVTIKNKVKFGNFKTSRSLNIPESISPPKRLDIHINSDGYVSPQTVYWKLKSGGTYVQTIQLGWGIYHLKKE